MIEEKFWKNKKIFVTGHTGFKGSWLCLWLHNLGAKVIGYALEPPTNPNMFDLCNIRELITDIRGDIRDKTFLTDTIISANPEIIIHLAAQPIVRESYKNPLETYSINVMGSVNLFEAIRHCKSIRAVINVTTDKCYENKEWIWGYRENDSLGGYDPYANSKVCSELITASYRDSFFHPNEYSKHRVAIATARAGNVIGGGDWAIDRLVPDCIRAILKGEPIIVRNPSSIRPWQHVIEALYGYLLLAQKLCSYDADYASAWNFGPNIDENRSVETIVKNICNKWGDKASYIIKNENRSIETMYLKIDNTKAKTKLNWYPKWTIDESIEKVIDWVRVYSSKGSITNLCLKQINEFISE